MARLKFKNFSDLAFIQGIDKPKYLGPLLARHEDYFNRQGFDVSGLKNDDRTDRRLLEVFTKPDEEMPAKLLEELYALDDLAEESGHDRILSEAQRNDVKLNGLGDDLTPGEFAIAVYLEHPNLVLLCHEMTFYRKIKNYQEYQAKDDKSLSMATVKSKKRELEYNLSSWFDSMNRSRVCETYAYPEDGEIKFQITHGRPYRTDGTIDKKLRRSRIAWRPQKHDSVVFDKKMKVLKINAQTGAEKEQYRKAFGEVLFGDPDHFPGGEIYTLEPLREGEEAMKIVAGIVTIRLTEVWIQVDDEQRFVQVSRAYDLIKSIQTYGKPNLKEGSIVRASFLVKYSSGGRPRKLELRPPNVAIYDRDRNGDVTKDFLHINGYFVAGEGNDGSE
jgi:hypothetical protein